MPIPPPEDPPVVLQKFTGLRNNVGRERLGPEELERAINVDIDDVGQIRRRRGYAKVASGHFSSLWETLDGTLLGVKDGHLGKINPDYSFTSFASGYSADPIAYVQVGPSVYFSSRAACGVIDPDAGTVVAWGSSPDYWYSPVVNPTATLPAIRGQLWGKPPFATCLAWYSGRIYLGSGRQVWATLPYLYNFVDKTKNYWTFEADITMVGAVSDGVYVGTTEGLWFVSGPYGEAKRTRVMDSGVIPGSMIYIPGEVANPPQIGLEQDTPVKVSILFLTNAGYCGGQDGGLCYNYSEDKFLFPDAVSAIGAYRNQDGIHHYIVQTNSGGDPSNNARIGDYVDGELLRAGTWKEIDSKITIGDYLIPTFVHV